MIKWEMVVIDKDLYCNIWVPIMHEGRQLKIGEVRSIVKGIRSIEKICKLQGEIAGWATWVEHDHKHVARLVEKLGAKPVIHKEEATWYAKGVK